MKIWKFGILILFILGIACNNRKPVNQNEVSEGISLFDGKAFDGWEISQFGTQGPVDIYDGKIVLGMGDGLTGITWVKEFPKINYEVSLEAMKISGNDFFCGITFPVNDDFCSFIVGGWGGPVVGLSTIDGVDASENSTKILKKLEKNTWYKIRLKVSPQKIIAWIDNEKVVDFEILEQKLSIRPEVDQSIPFGIASWNTKAALRNIRVKELEN